ncbi:hypothetical protein DAI22_01g423300 [Oryza sativa Japonica Group]|nr:hypothetical protein DAI22_01g423300 [Oryza sativa Japonica Group]
MRGRENGRSSLSGLQAWKLLPPGRLWKGRREGSYALLYQFLIGCLQAGTAMASAAHLLADFNNWLCYGISRTALIKTLYSL